jgi:hypothetical protein
MIFLSKKNNKAIFLITLVFALFVFLLPVDLVHADIGFEANQQFQYAVDEGVIAKMGSALAQKIYTGLGWIIYGIAWTIGILTSFLIAWLIQIANWSNFVGVDAVVEGWKMVRNLSNMFFILILLVIAFATILRLESYNVKKLLPKVIMMAVLINFSKTICQLIIEFAQVIMLTFVNAFTVNGSANLVSMLGIDQMWKMARSGQAGDSDLSLTVVGGLLIALIAMLIALVVIVVMIAMLVMRIIMLWIYIVLSPLAYLMAAFPQGQKYSSQWWGDFTKNVITGPVLAFFIWLALSTAQTSANNFMSIDINAALSEKADNGLISSFLSVPVFQTYIITIGFLVGGLVVTQQIGGVASSVAGKGISAIQKGKGYAMGKGKEVAIGAGKMVGRGALGVGGAALTGLTPQGSALSNVGLAATSWRNELNKSRSEAARDKRLATLKKMGMGEDTMKHLNAAGNTTTGRYFKAAAGAGGAAGLATLAGAPGAVVAAAGIAAAVKAYQARSRGKQDADMKAVNDAKANKSEAETRVNENFDQRTAAQRARMESRIEAARKGMEGRNESFQKLYEGGRMSKEDLDRNMAYAENDFRNEQNSARTDFDKDSGVVDANRIKADALKTINDTYQKELGGRDENMKVTATHPNKVMQEATKKGIEDITKAKQKVEIIAKGEDFMEFNKGDFHSASGQNASQKKFYDQLVSENETSSKALEKISASLKSVAQRLDRGEKVADKELEIIHSFKKGAASYEKGGGNISNLSEVIRVADKIPGKDGSVSSVSDLKEKVL